MRVNYLCSYCNFKFYIYTYYADSLDDKCPQCKETMTAKNIVRDVDKDTFGYLEKEKPKKEITKIDQYKNDKK